MTTNFDDIFPYAYVGVGMFRKKGYAEGEVAPILHGMEAVKYIFHEMQKLQTPVVDSSDPKHNQIRNYLKENYPDSAFSAV